MDRFFKIERSFSSRISSNYALAVSTTALSSSICVMARSWMLRHLLTNSQREAAACFDRILDHRFTAIEAIVLEQVRTVMITTSNMDLQPDTTGMVTARVRELRYLGRCIEPISQRWEVACSGRATFSSILPLMCSCLLKYVQYSFFSLELDANILRQQGWWIGQWVNAPSRDSHASKYFTIYAAIQVISATSLTAMYLALIAGGIKASRTLYSDLTTSMFSAPFRWWDRTPLGNALNRHTKDTEITDTEQVSILVEPFLSWFEGTDDSFPHR